MLIFGPAFERRCGMVWPSIAHEEGMTRRKSAGLQPAANASRAHQDENSGKQHTRVKEILSSLQKDGAVSVEQLSEQLDVSLVTVRRFGFARAAGLAAAHARRRVL